MAGQQRLAAASVLLIGAGGLGSPAALYLAAAGVGRLGLVDPDPVELSNLHRQILHGTADVGRPKVESAAARLAALNPDVAIHPIAERLSASNAERLFTGYDLILDGSDNFPTRYLANDAAVLLGKPLVHGAAIRFDGQVMTVAPRQSACYRCVFPEPPSPDGIPNCQDAGVLGVIPGLIGCFMAHEALKVLLGLGEPLQNRLLIIHGMASRVREVPVRRDPLCAVCGERPAIRSLAGYEEVSGTSASIAVCAS